MLLGVKADRFCIETEDKNIEVENVIIGISTHNLCKNDLYSALVGIDILNKEVTANDFVRANKK